MEFLKVHSPKALILVCAVFAVVYFIALLFLFPVGTYWLFAIFMVGELFRLWQLATYLYTIWEIDYDPLFDKTIPLPVDVFITVAGEPIEIIEETARAALAMHSAGGHHVYILNDGFAAKKENWRDVVDLAKELGIQCITREVGRGAKAGNINNALRYSASPLVAIFDADHVPHSDFLEKTAGYFVDPRMGFVQTPQYYKNHHVNEVARGAWEQQELFFGPIMRGKNRLNAAFMCGTNMVLRREALLQAGGMCETNIAEDFLTSLFIHERGWKSFYRPEVLAEGLAPEDFLSYYKQQFRWARGSLEVIFKYNPWFRSGLTRGQKMQYLASSSFYLTGLITFMNMLLPLLYLFFGFLVFNISTMLLAAIFFPYIFLTLYLLSFSSNFSFTFHSLAFTVSSFTIQIKAVWAVLRRQKNVFSVTSKKQLTGNFTPLVIPHIIYILLVGGAVSWAIAREGITSAILTNLSWALVSVASFLPFIRAALPAPTAEASPVARPPVLLPLRRPASEEASLSEES